MAGIAFGFHQLYKVSCLPGASRVLACHPLVLSCGLPPFGVEPLTPGLLTEVLHSVDAQP